MSIKLNTVGVEIDGTVYEMYTVTFGVQRRIREIQKQSEIIQDKLTTKHGSVEGATEKEQGELLDLSLSMIDIIEGLFVNPEEAKIVDRLDSANLTTLIEALS